MKLPHKARWSLAAHVVALVGFTAVSALLAWKFTSAMRKPQSENPQIFLGQFETVFDRAPAPKSWWSVPGAAHTDLYGFDPTGYEQHLRAFLATVR